jgi:hypothetical protein
LALRSGECAALAYVHIRSIIFGLDVLGQVLNIDNSLSRKRLAKIQCLLELSNIASPRMVP